VVVVGLDGVPFTLLGELMQKKYIPIMSKIFEQGYFGKMAASIPEISSVSWSSFMTGKQSGDHGIFGFIDLEPGTYKIFFPNYAYLKSETMWESIGKAGKKTVVINMPSTYPAREINGALISGFVAIDINKAVYPASLVSELNKLGYRIDLDTKRARQDHDFLFRDLGDTLTSRERAADLLWDDIPWDLFVVVITGTDRLMHFLWDAYEDPGHLHHADFLDYFRKVDRFIGRIYDKYLALAGSKEGDNGFFMLSDHGFTKIETEVYLNRWLVENGYLKFRKDKPETIMDIGPGSVAFAIDPSRIHINLKGKYPLGTVDIADYEKVRDEIKRGLQELTFNDGRKVARQIYTQDDLYQGRYVDRAPDLVVLSQHGYDLKGKVNNSDVFGRSGLQGMHTQDDAFFYSSKGTGCRSIFEIKQLIVDCLTT
jgi:predicted AlkP superfamily phosphohydrolase/phosphomutase